MAKSNKGSKLRELQEQVNNGEGVCSKCKRTDHLTVDHIIPFSLLEQLGIDKETQRNDEENFDVLCRWCNMQKANRLDHLNPKTVPLLKKYVAEYEKELSKL